MGHIKHLFFQKKQAIKRHILLRLSSHLPSRKLKKFSNNLGVYTLLCHRDMHMAPISFKSFFYYLGYELPLCIINDGTLTKSDVKLLNRLFCVKIISRSIMDKQITKKLISFPFYKSLRTHPKSSILKYKIDAAIVSPFDRTIMLDPDMVFQHKPKAIIDWIETKSQQILYTAHRESTFETDIYPEYAFRNMMFKYLKQPMTGSFSSGLMTFPSRNSISLSKIESIAKLLLECHAQFFGNIDEIILSGVLAGDKRANRLPLVDYLIMAFPRQYDQIAGKEATMIHFGFETKSMFYQHARKGIKKTNFFLL